MSKNQMNNKILILSGPTGSGESTLTKELSLKFPKFKRLITATSRNIRSGEIPGEDYYFFTKEEFLKEIEKGNIIEYTYIENRDTYYGSYKPDLEKKLLEGYVIVNVDHVGVQYYKKNYGAIAIFIRPDSIESIKTRLKKRNPEMTDEEIALRLDNAKSEIKNEEHFYDFKIINRDNCLNEALTELENILKSNGFDL